MNLDNDGLGDSSNTPTLATDQPILIKIPSSACFENENEAFNEGSDGLVDLPSHKANKKLKE